MQAPYQPTDISVIVRKSEPAEVQILIHYFTNNAYFWDLITLIVLLVEEWMQQYTLFSQGTLMHRA